MNQEEFDRRLKKTFNNEFIPPKEELWENIASRINPKRRFPLWLFIVPVAIVLLASLSFIYFSNSKNNTTKIVEKTEQPISITSAEPKARTLNSTNFETNKTGETIKNNINQTTLVTKEEYKTTTQPNKNDIFTKINNPLPQNGLKNDISVNNNSTTGNTIHRQLNGNIFNEFIGLSDLKLSFYKYKKHPNIYLFEKFEGINNPMKGLLTHKNKNNETIDLESYKWFLNFGIGPQLNINSIDMNKNIQPYVHKDLWSNKNLITANGSGFLAFANIGRKLSKNFGIETGFGYSRRTEDIRMDIQSYNIAFRNNINKIDSYARVVISIPIGPGDTTYFDVVASFNQANKNSYNIYSIPINFFSEHKISNQMLVNLSLGTNFTYITSKNNIHYNSISERKISSQKTQMFNVALNPKISFFTNFNDFGQIGVFAAYQMYLTKFNAIEGQYGIKMSDLQMGITFRKPLNF